MAISIVHKKQTGSAAAATLGISSAAVGNLLVAFINQTGLTGPPTGKDNISGSTGWAVQSTHSVYNGTTRGIYVALKTAVGGETELNPTSGGTAITGISYFELAGASQAVDTIVHTDNEASAKLVSTPAVTTTDAGDILLACVGLAGASGSIGEWNPLEHRMTNVETESTRAIGGSLIPAGIISAISFSSTWNTSQINGILLLALKATAATNLAMMV